MHFSCVHMLTDYLTADQLVQISNFNIVVHELYIYFFACSCSPFLLYVCTDVCIFAYAGVHRGRRLILGCLSQLLLVLFV